MISNDDGSVLVSSRTYADQGKLWIFDVARDRESRVSIGSEAKHLTVRSGASGCFAVAHHFEGRRFALTVHGFADPARVLASAVVSESGSEMTGDVSLFRHVPALYVEHVTFGPNDDALVRVLPSKATVEVEELRWYDETYDKGYQAVVAVEEVPGTGCAVFSVQRSSRLVLYDLAARTTSRTIDLAGRGGNPMLRFRRTDGALWATDYDTLVVLSSSWKVLASRRVQDASVGTMEFIGDFAFDRDETLCAVARPFSGDVVGLDVSTLETKWTAELGREPLELAVVAERRIIARDWKTGDTLRGELR